MTRRMNTAVTVGAMVLVFGAGYVCGVTQHQANADMNDVGGAVGGAVMNKAGESGGALGTAAKLGTSISDMQEQVNGLQKNLEVLKTIKSAIGG